MSGDKTTIQTTRSAHDSKCLEALQSSHADYANHLQAHMTHSEVMLYCEAFKAGCILATMAILREGNCQFERDA